MTALEFLQAGDSSFAIIGGVVAVAFFVWRARLSAIQSAYRDLALTWTNEGDIHGGEGPFIHLALQFKHGDLFGTLTSPQCDESYEAHVQPGWFSSTANISFLRGRAVEPIAKVKLRLKGNKNRLHWNVRSTGLPDFLPRTAELWPSPVEQSNEP